MQYIIAIIYFLILAVILIMPFATPSLLRRKGYVVSFALSSFLSFITCVLLASFLVYFPDLYASLQLDYLGFDFDGWSDEDRVKNIVPEFRDEATKLYQSRMGIGWTFQALIGAILLVPYQIVASGLVFIMGKLKKNSKIT